jgi:hypothetical protein
MANPIMGEVGFEIAGQHYIFKLGTYGRAKLQQRSGMTFAKFFGRGPESFGDLELLDLFYAGLYQRHQLSDEQVGELLDELGQARAGQIAAEAINLAASKMGVSAEAGKPNGNPTAAGQTIGIGSLPNG